MQSYTLLLSSFKDYFCHFFGNNFEDELNMNNGDFTSYKFSATQESWNDLLTLLPSESISCYKLSEIHDGHITVGLELCYCSKKLLQLYMMQIIGGLTMLQTLQMVPFKDMVSLN